MAIHQDSLGYLWFGTYAGISRYNGQDFFTLDSSDGLLSNSISDIAEDGNGDLYIATLGGGISIYDGYLVSRYCSEPELLSNRVYDILLEGDSLWAATDKGLSLIRNRRAVFYEFGDDIEAAYATTLFRDSNGRLWVGTEAGLYEFVDGGFRFSPYPQEQHDPEVNAIIEQNNVLWFGTSSGLFQLAGDSVIAVDTGLAINNLSINCAASSPNGNLWFGSNCGAILFSDGTFRLIADRNGLSDNTVNRILVDREINIWFGTDNGLSKLVWGPFEFYNHYTGLLSDVISDAYEDSEGRLWLASKGHGFTIKEKNSFSYITPAEGLPTPYVTSIIESKPGEYIIAADESVCYWDGRKFSVLDDRYGVTNLFKDSRGRVWIGSNAGPDYWFDGALQSYQAAEPLRSAYINCIKEDREGRIWFGTGRGAIVLDNDKLDHFGREDGFTDLNVWSIDVDRNGVVWLGTNGDGAFRYSEGRFSSYTTAQGLDNDFVWQVLADATGHIWFGTNEGLNRFDGKEFLHFTRDDGLAANEGMLDACIEDSNGTLWFCSGEGISYFIESRIQTYTYQPPVYITGVEINGRKVPFRQFNEYPYGDNQITFSFVGVSYRKERAISYQYKLEGLDNHWSNSTTARVVRYAKIPPGDYTFRVKASSADGIWSESEALFSFTILTPFYLEWWFPLAAIVIALCVLATWHRWRVHKVRRLNEELERKVIERTERLILANKELEAFGQTVSHDLNAPLRNIEGYASILIEDYSDKLDKQGQDFLRKIIDARRKLKNMIKDLLRFSQSTSLAFERIDVDLSLLVKLIVTEIKRSEPGRRIEFVIQPDIVTECSEPLIRLSLENLIDNAWKYTRDNEDTRIEFGSFNDNGHAVYFVRDNGVGFSGESSGRLFVAFSRLDEHAAHFEGTGLGLVTVRRIIERHGGRVWAEGKPGEGATFFFTLN